MRRPSFWKVSDTSAIPVGGRDSLPLKITSSMERPRRCFALCSPIAHRMASTTLDLPQPFGPTTPVTPSSKEKTTRSANDLKPEISRRRIFMDGAKIPESGSGDKACLGSRKMGVVPSDGWPFHRAGTLPRGSDIGLPIAPRRPRFRHVRAVPIAEAKLPRRPGAAIVDADPRPAPEPRLARAFGASGDEERRRRIAKVVAVHPEADAECLAEVAGPGRGVQEGQVTWKRFRGTQEDRVRVASGPADGIEHRVDAVDQIDVGVSGLAVHHLGPRGAASAGMAGEIVLADVRLRLDDPAGARLAPLATDEEAPDEIGRDEARVAIEEGSGKRLDGNQITSGSSSGFSNRSSR